MAMLTKLTVRNFKRFDDIKVDLGNPVVFIGPNNSGKTTAMQALTLWELGVKRWAEKRSPESVPTKRSGVAVNRRDLVSVPVPDAKHLWHNLSVRVSSRAVRQQTRQNVRIEVIVEGTAREKSWQCGMEFDYANEESFYCRPLRSEKTNRHNNLIRIPDEATAVQISFLQPLSGLASAETRLDQGAIKVRIGEGRTAEVLRNLCFLIAERNQNSWIAITERIRSLFGVELLQPQYVQERGEITLAYQEGRSEFDISASGRGLLQTLLILAYMHNNVGAVILLDEPDAHLETLRQRQIYELITIVARKTSNQIIVASHSEILLNEAAGRDLVVAFVGKPHRFGDRPSQVRKALVEIGFDQYLAAEQTGWVLYLEGSTDFAILKAFARRLDIKDAIRALDRPFVHYAGNQPSKVADHFYGLLEACPDLHGIAIYDRLDRELPNGTDIRHMMWSRREIENYLCTRRTLEAYAFAEHNEREKSPLISEGEAINRLEIMQSSIEEVGKAMELLNKGSPWSADAKVSDDFLTPLFQAYFKKLGQPYQMAKGTFYELAEFVPIEEIDPEISDKLDAIAMVCGNAGRPEHF